MTDIEDPRPTKFTPRSFRHSVHQIPTPGVEQTRPPRYEPLVFNFWFVRAVSLSMIILGIALAIAFHFSKMGNGFAVPPHNVFSFVSTQFLTSFFPTVLIIPLVQFWSSVDWLLRWYQPYVTLSQAKAPAARSILLDYVALNPLHTLYNSWVYKHYLVGLSGVIALSALVLQPLAGSLFQLRKVPHTSVSDAFLVQTVGLSPTIDNLDGYLASSGFSLASVFNDDVNPPFVHGVWATGQFQAPSASSYLNGTISVNTTAIRTDVNCVSHASLNVTNEGGSYVATATFPNGCSANNTFNTANGTQQFNAVNISSCASQDTDIKFQPVAFWFYLYNSSPQVASVSCNPTMDVFMVETSMNLTTGSLGPCTIIEVDGSTNNVTGSPQYRRPYNGIVFEPTNDFYVSSRAQAINLAVADAIYAYASRQNGGLSSVFKQPHGFLNATHSIYTQYLSTAAKNNFFLSGNSTIPALLTSQLPRLFIEALPAYILSPLLIVIGAAGFWVQLLHRRARRQLWLTSPPGSIAAIVSLTSRSGFGQLLLPYDDEQRMHANLAGLTFYLDDRTGAIVAEDTFRPTESADGVALLEPGRMYADSPPPSGLIASEGDRLDTGGHTLPRKQSV